MLRSFLMLAAFSVLPESHCAFAAHGLKTG